MNEFVSAPVPRNISQYSSNVILDRGQTGPVHSVIITLLLSPRTDANAADTYSSNLDRIAVLSLNLTNTWLIMRGNRRE